MNVRLSYEVLQISPQGIGVQGISKEEIRLILPQGQKQRKNLGWPFHYCIQKFGSGQLSPLVR